MLFGKKKQECLREKKHVQRFSKICGTEKRNLLQAPSEPKYAACKNGVQLNGSSWSTEKAFLLTGDHSLDVLSVHRAQTERRSSRPRTECVRKEGLNNFRRNDCFEKEEGSSVVDTVGGHEESLEDNEGVIVHVWVNCKGGLQLLAVFFWHSEGWIEELRLC